MKKFLIGFLYVISILLIGFYMAFLTAPLIVNKFYDFEQFKPIVQKLIKENSKLNLNYNSIKIYTTPMLSIGASVDNISVDFDDKTNFINIEKVKGGIWLPAIFALNIKTANVEITSPKINVEAKDKQYKIVQIVEDIVNENNQKPQAAKQEPSKNIQKLMSMVKINVPNIKITDLDVKVFDNKNSLTLNTPKLNLGYFGTLDGKKQKTKFKTIVSLFSNENQNILADLKVKIELPDAVKGPKEEIDKDEKIKIPFIDLIEIYQTYDLNMNTVARLNLKKNGIYGFLNVDDFNLKLSSIRLPNSFLHTKFSKNKVQYDSSIYVKDDEKIALTGDIKLGKHPYFNSNIQSDKIYFKNILDLTKGLLDSLNIKNDIASIETKGYLEANADIKTNFKKLKSKGNILIKEGSFINTKNKIGIKNLEVGLIFDDNALNIKDTHANINNSNIDIEGYIDNKTNTKINLDIKDLPLETLYVAFCPKEIKRDLNLKKANLSVKTNIEGKLDNLEAKIKTSLENLALNDTKNTMFINNSNLNLSFDASKDGILGQIENNGFNFTLPKAKTKAQINNLKISLDENNIKINPFDVIYNSLSKINIQGQIENYLKDPNIDIFADGKISTINLKETLGKEISYYLVSKGSIPFKTSIKGDSKKQEILTQIYSDNANYITPVDIAKLIGKKSIMQADITFKGNKIKLKDSGLYLANAFSNDLKSNVNENNKIADLTAIIDNNHINLFRLTIPKRTKAKISIFKKSGFDIQGKMLLRGAFDDLAYLGNINISNINIPELLFKLGAFDMDFNSKNLNLKGSNIDLNGSQVNGNLKVDLNSLSSDTIKIKDLLITSNSINVDKALIVLEKLNNYLPAASASKSPKEAAQANIPIKLDGKFNINNLKTGMIELSDTKGNLNMEKNNLYINNLGVKGFDGNISGNITMNLINGLMDIKLKGNNINYDKLMIQAAGLKDTITGTGDFTTDISLKGSTYLEQVKSLKGNVTFKIKEGQYGPFAKLENFFLAENIRENPVFKATIGSILTPIATIDSSHFENLIGNLNFKDGNVYLSPITSQGDILCILIKGQMNLISNELDTFARVRLASAVSDLLGPIAVANPVNLVKNTPGLNIATAKLFTVFTTVVQESEYKEIPDFSAKHSDINATKFQIILKGDVNKPLKLVKSFKWLALKDEMELAQEFSNKYILEQQQQMKQALMEKLQKEYEENNKLKVGVEKVLKMDTTAPKVKEMLVDEILNTRQELQNKQNEIRIKNEQKKQEAIQKLQNKNLENQQKLKNFEQNLQNKIQDKIKPVQSTESSNSGS